MTYIIDLTDKFNDGTLATYLSVLPNKMKAAAVKVLDRDTDSIVQFAQQIVPVDTGTLRGSIRKMQVSETEFLVTAGGADINPKTGRHCNYAEIVEQRTPYLKPAVDRITAFTAEEIRTEVISEIE